MACALSPSRPTLAGSHNEVASRLAPPTRCVSEGERRTTMFLWPASIGITRAPQPSLLFQVLTPVALADAAARQSLDQRHWKDSTSNRSSAVDNKHQHALSTGESGSLFSFRSSQCGWFQV